MIEKILQFVIGFLVGAIITTTGFGLYNRIITNNSKEPEMIQMEGQQPWNMEEPPTKPEETNN